MADPYNPTQTVAPNVGSPNSLLQVRADPNAFGAQVGQALQGLGQEVGNAAAKATNTITQYQGMINESLATDANAQTNVQSSEVYGWYKSQTGLAAVSAREEAIKKVQTIHDNIAKSLPNDAARRAYISMSSRERDFMIQDINVWSASQVRAAQVKSAEAARDITIAKANQWEVANDDYRFGALLGDIKAQTLQGMDGYFAPGDATQDPRTGVVTFADTDSGKKAKVIFEDNLNKAVSAAWKNRIYTLRDDPGRGMYGGIIAANRVLEENKEKVPPDTLQQLRRELAAPLKANEARQGADSVFFSLDGEYKATVKQTAPIDGEDDQTFKARLRSQFFEQESGNGRASTNLGQIQPGTWNLYVEPGEISDSTGEPMNIDNPDDNKTVTDRLLEDLIGKYGRDVSRIATAYFSGPGNVTEPGALSPFKENRSDKDEQGNDRKSVESYVNDMTKRMGYGTNPSGRYQNFADYLRVNYARSQQQTRDMAEKMRPGDTVFADQMVSQNEQRVNEIIRTQELSERVDTSTVYGWALNGGPGGQLIGNIDAIQSAPKQIKDAWNRMQLNNPLQAEAFEQKVITANSRGRSLVYGSDFWKHYESVLTGKTNDPANLYHYVDPYNTVNSPLTNTGLNILTEAIKEASTPEGTAWAKAEMQFLNKVKGLITGTDSVPGALDAPGDKKWSEFLMDVVPRIRADKAAGKTAGQLFNEKSPDYVGKSLGIYQRSDAVKQQDWMNSLNSITPAQMWGMQVNPTLNNNKDNPFDFKTLDNLNDKDSGIKQLQDAVKNKKISPQAAKTYSNNRGWTIPRPEVPNAR